MSKRRILIIEDELHIAEGIIFNLKHQDYDVELATDGPSGLLKWQNFSPELIVLDLMLPQMNGFEVLQEIRKKDERLPVLILSAKDGPLDKVRGLELGAFDYMTKPFVLDEFLLRVKGMLQRSTWSQKKPEAVFRAPGLYIDFLNLRAAAHGREIILTEQEARLLKLFVERPNQILNREEILTAGWGHSSQMETRTVDNFIVRLRKYFEVDPKRPKLFKSVRGKGYLFAYQEKNQTT